MFIVESREAAAGFREQAEMETILRALARDGYQLTIRNMFSALGQSVGIDSTSYAASYAASHAARFATPLSPFRMSRKACGSKASTDTFTTAVLWAAFIRHLTSTL